MIYLLTFIHIVVSLVLIAVVLLQTGKRADLAGAFGGGGSQTAFGTRGAATLLSKATTAAAVLFMLTCMGLSILSSRRAGGTDSVLTEVDPVQTSAPAPAPAPVEDPLVPAAPVDDLGTMDDSNEVDLQEDATSEMPAESPVEPEQP